MVLKPCAMHPKEPMFLLYMVQEALHMVLKPRVIQEDLHMVLKPCARPLKQPMVLLYMVQEGIANGF